MRPYLTGAGGGSQASQVMLFSQENAFIICHHTVGPHCQGQGGVPST